MAGACVTYILIASAIVVAITIPIFLHLHTSRIPGALTFAASASAASAHLGWRASGVSASHGLIDIALSLLMLLGGLLLLSGFRQFVSKPAIRSRTLAVVLMGIAGLLALFTFLEDNIVGRTVVSTGAASIIVAITAWTLVRGFRDADTPAAFKLVAIFCASITCAFFMSRWIAIVGGFDSWSYFVNPTPWNLAISSIRLLLFPTMYLSVILLLLGRTVTRLQRSLDHDNLTGALSRQAFLDIAAPWFDPERAVANDVALLFLDLDHFKRINDSYGHQTGDRALRHFAEVTSKVLPRQARLGRLGGEEFAVLLPASKAEAATLVGENILNALRAAPLSGARQSISITVSIGVAAARPGDSIVDALKRADEALYRAKASGRDRLCLADEIGSLAGSGDDEIDGGERQDRRIWIEAAPPLVSAS
ncbi:MAG: diguanylate cyclase [Rhizobiaceae bacterium]|nr:diguanylate cyclase [Rhizobiaceae bacterium]